MKTCVILLAAGQGTRFGGPKQLRPVDNLGRCLAELSIRDAASAGFDGALLVVRAEHMAEWQSKSWPVPVDFVVQPSPLGTGDALYRAQRAAVESGYSAWAVANADDYYGTLWHAAAECVHSETMAALAYPLNRVLSARGAVNRAVLTTDAEGNLERITEYRGLSEADLNWLGNPMVSMNAWVFNRSVLPWWPTDVPTQGEFGIPDALSTGLAQGARVRVLAVGETWKGLTFPEDYADILAYFQTT